MKKVKHALNLLRFIMGSYHPIASPIKVTWDVTNRCNARCRHCKRWKSTDRDDLTFEEGMNLLKQLAENDVISISFSGGEPFLRKDIFELIRYANSLDLRTTVNSNGLLINKEMARKIVSSGLEMIYISLDGASPEVHDYIRGIDGLFQRTIKAMKTLKEESRNSNPKIFVNMEINNKNVGDVLKVAEICRENDLDGLTIEPIHVFSEVGFDPDKSLLFTPNSARILQKQIEILKKEYKSYLPHMNEYFDHFYTFVVNPSLLYKYRCTAGYFTLQIYPNGDVVTCSAAWILGNLREKTFSEIWYSEKADYLRQKIKNKNHPICWFNWCSPLNILLSYVHPMRFDKLLDKELIKYLYHKVYG